MKLEEIDIELLEAYWRAELDEVARHTLEERLQNDMAFQEAATELQQVQEGLRELQLRNWRSQLTQIEQKAPPIVLKKPVWWRRYGWVLIAGVLLLALLFILKIVGGKPDPSPKTPAAAVAQANYEHLPYLGERMDDTLEEAAILYEEKKDYAKAEVAMLALFQETGDSSKLMYAVLAAVGNNQGARVIPVLKQLVHSSSFESVQVVLKWNLALAYLQADSFAESQKVLNQLTTAEKPWPEKAKSLSKQIAGIQKK